MTQSSRTAPEALRILLPVLILAVAVGGFLFLQSLKERPASATPPDRTPVVETALTSAHEGGIKIVVSGEVVPYREVEVASELSGRVATKEPVCEAGTFVREGDPLFKIDEKDYALEERRLKKELEQSQAYLDELAAEIEGTLLRLQVVGQEVASLESEYQRQFKLRGVVSDSQISKAKREWLAAQNTEVQLRSQRQLLEARKLRLQSALELVEVQLEMAQLDVQRSTIRSPVTGVITSEHVQQDAYVQKGETLLTIEDTSQAEVTCHLDADDEQWIWLSHPELLRQRNEASEPSRDYDLPDTPAKVIYQRGDIQYRWDGVLTRYDGLGFDPDTRTIPCLLVVSNPRQEEIVGETSSDSSAVGPRALVRGMFVTVEIYTDPKVDLLRVPTSAIQPGNRLWTVQEAVVRDKKNQVKSVLQKRTVKVVDQIPAAGDGEAGAGNSLAVVYAPAGTLQVGDPVVTSPLSDPRDNQPVKLAQGKK